MIEPLVWYSDHVWKPRNAPIRSEPLPLDAHRIIVLHSKPHRMECHIQPIEEEL
jgi:hypothetical protein